MKTMTIEILRSVIIDAVKTETHIKGTIDKSLDEKASRVAYNQTAAADAHHARISTNFPDTAKISISVGVDDRFNTSFASTIARLGSEYITHKVLVTWYGAISTGANQVPFYENLAQVNLNSIRKCFNKKAPTAPTGTDSNPVSILNSTGSIV